LQARLASVGSSLVLRKGPAAEIIAALARETRPGTVFWNEIAHAPQKAVAGQVAAVLEATGVASQSFPGDLLAPPTNIRNKDGRGFRVFTPFWRRVLAVGDPPEPLLAPKTLRPRRASWATRSRAGASSPRIRTGPMACAKAGRRASYPGSNGSEIFLQPGWRVTLAGATAPIGTARPHYLPTCASAR
jgi:deoxyribodipyrimidine photolyase